MQVRLSKFFQSWEWANVSSSVEKSAKTLREATRIILRAAEGDGEAARIEQEPRGSEQVRRVALRRTDDDDVALAALEALDGVHRGELHRACCSVAADELADLLQGGALVAVGHDDAEAVLDAQGVRVAGEGAQHGRDQIPLELVAGLADGFVVDDHDKRVLGASTAATKGSA